MISSSALPRVAVCIATRRRPEGLTALLMSLAEQTYSNFTIVVVENDTSPTCEGLSVQLAQQLGLDICYVHQPLGGIPHARNSAIDAIPDDVEWVAFIDDDEVAVNVWLQGLLHQARTHNADVVTGPVLPQYHPSVPQWLIKGGFFEVTAPMRSGERVRYARSGNVLVHRRWFDRFRFDERLKESGGSDTQFFQQVIGSGAKCVWSEEAIVHEEVPASRASTDWLIRRSFRYGNTLAVLDRLNGRSLMLRTMKGFALIALGSARLTYGVVAGREQRLRGRLRIARGQGSLRGVLGHTERAYPVGDVGIVNLVTHLEPAGAQSIAVWLSEGLRSRGYATQTIFIFHKRPAFPKARGLRVLFDRRPPAWRAPGILGRVASELRELKPKAVITHSHFASILGCAAAWIVGVPVRVATLHNPVGTFPRSARWLGVLMGMTGIYTHIVAVSESVAQSASGYPRSYRKRMRVVHNGVTLPAPPSSREATRAELGVANDTPVLLHIGRFNEQKNHDFLLRISDALPGAVLLLVGDGERRAEIESRAQAASEEGRIRFLGELSRDQVAALFCAADVFLFPSRFEAFGLVMVEAMAAGCPVIASDIPSSREVLKADSDQPAGIVLPIHQPAHVEEWVKAVDSMLNDPSFRETLVHRGQVRASEYSIEAMIDGYESIAAK